MNSAPWMADLLIAFNLGLLSQVHCIGMCGGVITALSLGVERSARERDGMLRYAVAYNAGRIVSYVCAGFLLGGLGAESLALFELSAGHRVLQYLAATVLFLAGCSLLGFGRATVVLEGLGQRAWRVLQRPARAILPITRPRDAWLFGLLWGWLPCALVYATLLFAAATASAPRAGLVMLAFGLGTSPALIAAGTASGSASGWLRRPGLRRGAGVVMILIACSYPFLGAVLHGAHSHH